MTSPNRFTLKKSRETRAETLAIKAAKEYTRKISEENKILREALERNKHPRTDTQNNLY